MRPGLHKCRRKKILESCRPGALRLVLTLRNSALFVRWYTYNVYAIRQIRFAVDDEEEEEEEEYLNLMKVLFVHRFSLVEKLFSLQRCTYYGIKH